MREGGVGQRFLAKIEQKLLFHDDAAMIAESRSDVGAESLAFARSLHGGPRV
jgi:hypothetical protein